MSIWNIIIPNKDFFLCKISFTLKFGLMGKRDCITSFVEAFAHKDDSDKEVRNLEFNKEFSRSFWYKDLFEGIKSSTADRFST